MPVIHFVGKTIDHKGKKLFEILCNLKNFGKGRVVVRNKYRARYAEPTFYRITSAEPKMDAENDNGIVRAEHIFRGVNFGEIEFDDTFKKDWQLLSKEEEAEYCKGPFPTEPEKKILPAYSTFPPIFKQLILRDRKAQGLSTDEEPMFKLLYKENRFARYRVARPGEKPTVQLRIHACPSLYEKTKESSVQPLKK